MATARQLADYCQKRLSDSINDYSLNGLQYEGVRPVATICAAVDATLEAVEAAASAGAELLLVHHGLFWGKNPIPLTGRVGEIVRSLVMHDVSLLAYHLPLDAHAEVGNNALLAKELALTDIEPFALYGRVKMGFYGTLPKALPLPALAAAVAPVAGGSKPRIYAYGADTVSRLAIVSGRGVSEEWLIEAKNLGCEAFLTGEVVYEELLAARHLGMNIIAAGHYQTERFGVQALGQELALEFGLNYRFIELQNSIEAR